MNYYLSISIPVNYYLSITIPMNYYLSITIPMNYYLSIMITLNVYLSITIPMTALPKTPPISNVVENIPAWALVYFSCGNKMSYQLLQA